MNSWLDDQFWDVGSRRQLGKQKNGPGNVVGLKDFGPMLLGWGNGAFLQNGRIDFARE